MKKVLIAVAIISVVLLIVYFVSKPKGNQNISPRPNQPAGTNTQNDNLGWQVYQSDDGYQISYPQGVTPSPNGDYSVLFTPDQDGQVVQFVYISAIPADQSDNESAIYNYFPSYHEALMGLDVGESQALVTDEAYRDHFTFTRLSNRNIAGMEAKVFTNGSPWEFPEGTVETRFIIERPEATFMIGYYLPSNATGVLSNENVEEMLSTFSLN